MIEKRDGDGACENKSRYTPLFLGHVDFTKACNCLITKTTTVSQVVGVSVVVERVVSFPSTE